MRARPPGWLLPRRTVRLRMTLLYSALFLAAGALLLTITYVLVAHRMPLVRPPAVTLPAGTAGVPPVKPSAPPALSDSYLRAQQAAELRQLLTESGIALAIMAAASVLLGWLMAGRMLRPVRKMATAARQISENNLRGRLAVRGPDDELKSLGDTFDDLLARLEAAFAAERQFVANASHELRTPLTYQRAMIEVALADPDATADSLRAMGERVLDAGQHQERLIEALLTLARSQRGVERPQPVDLAPVTAGVLSGLRQGGAAAIPRIEAELAAAPMSGDPRLLERLVANLLSNAIRHNQADGWISVRTGTSCGQARLWIANSGPVIPASQVQALFQPFRRLADNRDGIGLGLAIVAAVVKAHKGRLKASPEPQGGLEIEISFPTPGAAPPRAEPVSTG